MTGKVFSFSVDVLTEPRFGIIALQTDETIEADMRRLLPEHATLMVSRVPSGTEVTSESLAEMEGHLGKSAALLPASARFDAIGYGCTSGTAQIGAEHVARRIGAAVPVSAVTNPLTSLVAVCKHLGLQRIALLSPYIAQVSERLRTALATQGVETPVFGSFEVADEATVVRISASSINDAVRELMEGADVDGLFLSCTNLRTLDVIDPLEQNLGKPVLSSNQVLAWHMMHHAGLNAPAHLPGRLFRT